MRSVLDVWAWSSHTLREFVSSQVLRVLSSGPVPEHLAIIMDGNRRWARSRGLDKARGGHLKGFDKLRLVLQWLLRAEQGVQEMREAQAVVPELGQPQPLLPPLTGPT